MTENMLWLLKYPDLLVVVMKACNLMPQGSWFDFIQGLAVSAACQKSYTFHKLSLLFTLFSAWTGPCTGQILTAFVNIIPQPEIFHKSLDGGNPAVSVNTLLFRHLPVFSLLWIYISGRPIEGRRSSGAVFSSLRTAAAFAVRRDPL